MSKITTILIDDEQLARDLLRTYLNSFKEIEIVAECEDGFQALKAITELKPDFIFLDIQMPKITGFELLEVLTYIPEIIFTTAFDQYAIKAFEMNATDYLLKPYSKERFAAAVEKILKGKRKLSPPEKIKSILNDFSDTNSELERVVVKTGNKVKVIGINEILYFEAQDDYVYIFTAEGKYLKQQTLKFFTQNLPQNQFCRVHRSYLVNINEIAQIDPYEKDHHRILLKNNSFVPVSRSGYSSLKNQLKF